MKTKSIFALMTVSLTVLMLYWGLKSELFAPKTILNKPETELSPSQISRDYENSEISGIQLTGNLLSVNVHDRPIQSVVMEIAQQAGFSVHFDKHLPNPNINLQLVNQPVHVGLEHLLQDNDSFYFYSQGKGRGKKLSALWVYRKGDGALLSPNNLMVGLTQSDAAINSSKNAHSTQHSYADNNQNQQPFAKESRRELAEVSQDALKLDKANDINQLMGFAQNGHPEIRMQALSKLASLEGTNSGAVDSALETALSDKDAGVRGYALQILSNRLGEDAYDYQRQALFDPDVSVRIAAIETVIPNSRGKMLLEEGLLDNNELIRKIAEDRLKQFVEPKNDEAG